MLFPIILVTIIGAIAGLILAIASKYMAVSADERFDSVREVLPGANCGACGFAGCDEYAKRLAHEPGTPTNLCTPGGDGVSRKISEALGAEYADVKEMYGMVRCSGKIGCTDYVMDYQGPQTCAACNSFYQGRGKCSHACLGFGDCVSVCQYDALHMVDGIASIDKSKCTGCGMCVKMCPNHLIRVVDKNSDIFVGCSSTDKGAFTRKLCTAGCIGCKKCEKACQFGAITITDNLASIDPEKCTNCKACVEGCPTGVIKVAADTIICC